MQVPVAQRLQGGTSGRLRVLGDEDRHGATDCLKHAVYHFTVVALGIDLDEANPVRRQRQRVDPGPACDDFIWPGPADGRLIKV